MCGVVVDEALDQLRQDRHDYAEREHVEQDGDEDEGDGTTPDRRSASRRRLAGIVAHDGRLRLWAKGLAFSRKVMRTGVPGSSKVSRMELVR
ncbi:hypothetical protein ACVIU4_005825 [Bradyrhizobium barranii subsp. barranii]